MTLSSGERELWPGEGITKGDLWDYYDAVSPVLVPHLRERPFTMKRFREGAEGSDYFDREFLFREGGGADRSS